MLRPRIIPCLLIHNEGLVKTQKFESPKYVGDPINAVRIFNEKEVDELTILNIDASVLGSEPDYDVIKKLAFECRMPLCYGGGVTTAQQVEKIVKLGVEKVALSSIITTRPKVISEAAERVGRQSIVAIIDVKKTGLLGRHEVVTHNATKRTGLDPIELAQQAEHLGAGEIVINSVDRDGMMNGYDLELVSRIKQHTSLPVTALGGAGSLADIETLLRAHPIIGAAAGSLFVFKGKLRAVLINYPNRAEKDELISRVNHA